MWKNTEFLAPVFCVPKLRHTREMTTTTVHVNDILRCVLCIFSIELQLTHQ